MKFIVVDDNQTFRNSIIFYLEDILSHEVIGSAGDGLEFFKLKNYYEADFILMDIEMPNLNGVETVKKAIWEDPKLKFIAITNYKDKAYLHDLISAGFKSCVYKENIHDELHLAIEAVQNGDLFFPADIKIVNGE